MIVLNDHIGLVKVIAAKFKGMLPMEDLIQAGLMGLYQASLIFDETKGYQFSSLASKYILGFIRSEIEANQAIHLPKRILRIVKYINEGKSWKLEELAIKLNTTKKDIITALTYMSIARFDESIYTNEYFFFDDLIEGLKHDERCLLILRYKYNMTELDIASLLNKSQSFVSKKIKDCLSRLRRDLIM